MTLKLPRLSSNIPVFDRATGLPTLAFVRFWDEVATRIETETGALAAAEAANAAAIAADAAATAANAAAASANSAASTAQTTADTVTAQASLNNSFTTGATVTATDAGASATISIGAHTRYYGDGTNVSVNAGSVTGLSYSTKYYVYYDQASRAGGAVTYVATTTNATAFPTTGNPDRHYVGAVTTPAAAAGPNTGAPAVPPSFDPPVIGFW